MSEGKESKIEILAELMRSVCGDTILRDQKAAITTGKEKEIFSGLGKQDQEKITDVLEEVEAIFLTWVGELKALESGNPGEQTQKVKEDALIQKTCGALKRLDEDLMQVIDDVAVDMDVNEQKLHEAVFSTVQDGTVESMRRGAHNAMIRYELSASDTSDVDVMMKNVSQESEEEIQADYVLMLIYATYLAVRTAIKIFKDHMIDIGTGSNSLETIACYAQAVEHLQKFEVGDETYTRQELIESVLSCISSHFAPIGGNMAAAGGGDGDEAAFSENVHEAMDMTDRLEQLVAEHEEPISALERGITAGSMLVRLHEALQPLREYRGQALDAAGGMAAGGSA